jgi:hypothetical protein
VTTAQGGKPFGVWLSKGARFDSSSYLPSAPPHPEEHRGEGSLPPVATHDSLPTTRRSRQVFRSTRSRGALTPRGSSSLCVVR